jgi:hypothetical protein
MNLRKWDMRVDCIQVAPDRFQLPAVVNSSKPSGFIKGW